MMFIVRTAGERPLPGAVRIVTTRRIPGYVESGSGQLDLFCSGSEDAPERLRSQGWSVIELRDGWYQGDEEGGVAIWGQGKFWEVRDTPFSVREAAGPG